MLRGPLLFAASSGRLKEFVTRAPLTRGVVARFVAGDQTADAVAVADGLGREGLLVTVDHLGEQSHDRAGADAACAPYFVLLAALSEAGLTARTEVSVKLSALGQALPGDGEKIALAHARQICDAAEAAGTTVTVDMEDHTTTDSTLSIVQDLRADFPRTGVALQAYLRRTEADCRDLAVPGSRVRLCKGAYREPAGVAYQSRTAIADAYGRCLRILMEGEGYPMVATHDPAMIRLAGALATGAGRQAGAYEYQMLYGVRPDEQRRLVASGAQVRVYLPYGVDWYGYLVRRLAEKPANLALIARALTSRG